MHEITKPHIPENIELEAKKYFESKELYQAFDLLQKSQVKIDYSRGHLTGPYYIVSGAIFERKEHVANLKLKKNGQDHQEGHLTSSCDCSEWTEFGHCRHIASLFLKYHLLQTDSGPQTSQSFIAKHGATVENYGTILTSVSHMKGVARGLTFQSCQYRLRNQEVIHYPKSELFEHQLVISMRRSWPYQGPEDQAQENIVSKPSLSLSFSYQERGQQRSHSFISLFEHTHLFNWETGELFHFNNELMDVMRKIRYQGHQFSENDFLRLFRPFLMSGLIQLDLNSAPLDLDKTQTVYPRIEISQAKRRSYFHLELSFLDEHKNPCPLPDLCQLLSFKGGLLGNFRKKSNAFEFLSLIKSDLENETKASLTALRSHTKRTYVEWIMKDFFFEDIVYFVNNRANEESELNLYECSCDMFRSLLFHLIDVFDVNFFRFSEFDSQKQVISIELPQSFLLSGLGQFYQKMHIHGLEIFYDQKKVSQWSGQVKFERKRSSLNWFDLNLSLRKEDLELIKKAAIGEDVVSTNQGLLLLSPDQKELMKFLKRYALIEAQEVKTEEDSDIVSLALPLKRARIFELFELRKIGLDGALTPEEIELCERLSQLSEMPEYDVPTMKKGEPRSYQVQGYQWLRFLYEHRFGACLADDMGLGKTLQTILFLMGLRDKIKRVLIVCPVSILMNWKQEFEKFSDLDVSIYYGGDRQLDHSSQILLSSYGVMKKEAQSVLKELSFDILILDEVQHLKNAKSIGAIAARELEAEFKICLTGTPVENDLSEFYNILDLCIPGIWGNLSFSKSSQAKHSRLLARKTARPFILRRTKDQVLSDLPEKEENHVFLDFTPEERAEYDQTLEKIKGRLTDIIPKKRYGEILKSLLTLRQLCLWQKKHHLESTKIDFLLQNLEQIRDEGHQAIIFSQFTTYLDLIQTELEKRTWRYSRIDGSKSLKQRQKDVDLFQNGKNSFFLISLKAGGVGLNLTAAHYVFLMDPWWNPAVEAQAIDRAHRIGQQNKLTVYRPIIKNSVEEKVLKLQEFKKELFHDLMAQSDDSYFTGKLTMNDFEDLLK